MLANEALHAQLKKQGIENQDIIRKGTCFGAFGAAESAALYEGCNVIIDQAFATSQEAAKESFNGKVAGFVGTTAGALVGEIANPLIGQAVKTLDFDYTLEHLSNVTGLKLVIGNDNDGVVNQDHTKRIAEMCRKSETSETVQVQMKKQSGVEHAGGWWRDHDANKAMKSFLQQIDSNSGSII
jgi:hypothetical protein